MKKSLFILAVLGAFASVAHAQTVNNDQAVNGNSVTLYGIIDGGLDYVTNATDGNGSGHQLRFSDGIMQGSRFGLKGREVIGGGTSAIFQLENGFNVMHGTLGNGGRMFGRQAYVGLTNSQYGTVTLGRQYDNAVDFVGPLNFADQIGGSYAAHLADVDNLNNSYRFSNAIKYQTPDYHGLQAGAMYSLGGWAGSITKDQAYSVGAGYATGPIQLGAGYVSAKNPGDTLYGYNDSVYGNENQTAALNSGNNYANYGGAGSYRAISVGGAYTIGANAGQPLPAGAAQVGLVYSNTRFGSLGGLDSSGTATPGTGSAKYNNIEVNGTYQATPQLAVGAAYNFTKGKNVFGMGTSPNYHQVSLAADYTITPRTDVYAQVVGQQATGGGIAQINALTPSSNNRQLVGRIGLRHKF